MFTGTYLEKQKIDQVITGQAPTQGEQFGYSVAIDSKGTVVAIGSPEKMKQIQYRQCVYISRYWKKLWSL